MTSRPLGIHTLLSVLLLLTAAPRGFLVLCVAEDGHVALEVGGHVADSAVSGDFHEPVSQTASCECSDPCGPCRDSEVGTSFRASLAPARALAVPGPSPQPIAMGSTASADTPQVVEVAACAGRAPSTWTAHRGIVSLRI
jgi:hypothetical protein